MVNKMYVLTFRKEHPFWLTTGEDTASDPFTTLKIIAEDGVSFRTERDPDDKDTIRIVGYRDPSDSSESDDSEDSNSDESGKPSDTSKPDEANKPIESNDSNESINTEKPVIVTTYDNYKKPPIPSGYEHILGTWDTGFVIKSIADGSEFVWVPVGSLKPNGIFDDNLMSRFGRRRFKNERFSKDAYWESHVGPLELQRQSVAKYGGFYVSRYLASENKFGKPQFVEGEYPLINLEFKDARTLGAQYEQGNDVQSHLMFGCEYGSLFQWILESGAKTLKEISRSSTGWGNYCNSKDGTHELCKTGSSSKYCVNEIYDLAGNVFEITQERYGKTDIVVRGGSFKEHGDRYPAACRNRVNEMAIAKDAGFRVALWLNPKVK